ncbi:TetR family transcriptional regulator [Flavisphingomonas formosensis]|uniref:TetR family transcriptional regulator n=1 Tax=Flavisphingomonas formosensis TaxID=861534 RepID=UPI0012F85CDB|nr:TetR family transcriptional regulator [Sphingomonas formosensis]
MTDRPIPRISARKGPKQARSAQLVADILAAAVQVLEKEGAQRFTTARVAERAGVSVGSLYQYFPNKAAILFRLQADEWRETGALLRDLLADPSRPPLDRLRTAVHAFVRSECEEAAMRGALDDAAPLYRDAPEAQEPRLAGTRTLQAFMAEALPGAPDATRTLAAELVMMTLGDVGKAISERHRAPEAAEPYAAALADMLCGYLEGLRVR